MTLLLRYGAVGVINTVIGYGIILCGLRLGLGDYLSNLLGYMVGMSFSFFANRHWTWNVRGVVTVDEVATFAATFAIAYSANLLVVNTARSIGLVDNPVVHIAAMAAYSGISFVLSSRWVFAYARSDSRPAQTLGLLMRKHSPELALCLLAAGTLHWIGGIRLTHDVSWQFWIARQMLAGARLYRDIWEVNPPLWFWSALPVEYLAQSYHVSFSRILVAIIIAMGALSALLVGRIADIAHPMRRFAIMGSAFWFCVPMPLFDFGQREQFAIICALPYAALIANRRKGKPIPLALALCIGLFAAYGFALKHYFLLVPIVLEAWLALSCRRGWRFLRPETITLGGLGFAYAVAVLLLAPDYLSFMVPMVKTAYHGYNVPFINQVDEAAQVIWLLAAIALVRTGGVFGKKADSLTTALTLTAFAFLIAYFAQQKGWQYHAIPVTAAILLAIVVRLSSEPLLGLARYPLSPVTIAFAIFVGMAYGPYHDFLRSRSEPLLTTVPRGEPVAALAADPMWIWPVAEEHGLVWPLRLYSYWMLPAIGHAEVYGPRNPALSEVADHIRRQTLADLRCNPPAIVLIEIRPRYEYQPAQFDVAAFFLRGPGLHRFLANHYTEETRTRFFRVFRRITAIARPTVSGCRRIAPSAYSYGPPHT